MATKSKSQTAYLPDASDLSWRLSVPCVAIMCDSVDETEIALAELACLDGYQAGAMTTLDGHLTAVARIDGSLPDLPGVQRTWLSGRAARVLGLPNPLQVFLGEE